MSRESMRPGLLLVILLLLFPPAHRLRNRGGFASITAPDSDNPSMCNST